MLDAETKEGIRRSAERVSSTLTDAERQTAGQRAHRLVDHLHEDFPDDDTAAKVAFMLAAVLATLHSAPLRSVNHIIESSIDTYTFAAGRLAAVYELPLRNTDDEEASDDGPPPYIPAPVGEDVESTGTGFYL